jgi:hypothetical protein
MAYAMTKLAAMEKFGNLSSPVPSMYDVCVCCVSKKGMGLALIYCHGQLGKMKFQTMGWNGAPLLQDQSLLHRKKGFHIISRMCPLAGLSDSVQDTIPIHFRPQCKWSLPSFYWSRCQEDPSHELLRGVRVFTSFGNGSMEKLWLLMELCYQKLTQYLLNGHMSEIWCQNIAPDHMPAQNLYHIYIYLYMCV